MADSSTGNSLPDERDIDDLEKLLYSVFTKQNSTELKLKETYLQLQEMTLAKLELERLLESERRELSNMKAQYKMKQRWELENCAVPNSESSFGKEILAQKIQLESIKNERDALLESVGKLQSENMNLKMEVENNKKQLVKQRKLENLINVTKSSIDAKFENIIKQNCLLISEKDSLKKMVDLSKKIGQYLIHLLKQHHKVLDDTFAENRDLKTAHNLLLSELKLMKQHDHKSLTQASSSKLTDKEQELESQMNKYISMVASLTNQINAEKEERKNLSELLVKTLNEQMDNITTEQTLKARIKQLEEIVATYEDKKSSLSANEVDSLYHRSNDETEENIL